MHLFNRGFCYHGYFVLAKENGQKYPILNVSKKVPRTLALPSKTKGHKSKRVPPTGLCWAEPLRVKSGITEKEDSGEVVMIEQSMCCL